MVRNYKRKQGVAYGSSSPENIQKAVVAVSKGMSLRKASETYSIKKSTLYDHVSGKHILLPGKVYTKVIKLLKLDLQTYTCRLKQAYLILFHF